MMYDRNGRVGSACFEDLGSHTQRACVWMIVRRGGNDDRTKLKV